MTGDAAQPPEAGPDLPATLAARPVDARRGLPVPPVNIHPDPASGAAYVDFTTLNTTTSTALAAERRCSLCGVEMGYWAPPCGCARTSRSSGTGVPAPTGRGRA